MDIMVSMMPAPPKGIEQSAPVTAKAGTAHQEGTAASMADANATAPGAEKNASRFAERGLGRRHVRLELDIDGATGRVVGKFIDRETGDVIRQVPSEEMMKLLARARELVASILNDTAQE